MIKLALCTVGRKVPPALALIRISGERRKVRVRSRGGVGATSEQERRREGEDGVHED